VELAQCFEEVTWWDFVLLMLLELPIVGPSGVKGENHKYNGHVHHNMKRFVCTKGLVLVGLITMLLVCSARPVPLGCVELITLATLVTMCLLVLVSFPLILFLGIERIICDLPSIHLTLRRQWLLWQRLIMHGRLRH